MGSTEVRARVLRDLHSLFRAAAPLRGARPAGSRLMPHPHASATFRRDVATHAFQSSARARARPNAEREGAGVAARPVAYVVRTVHVRCTFAVSGK